MILTTCQPARDFMAMGEGIAYIVYIYIFVQFSGGYIKFPLNKNNFQGYLIYIWSPNRYYHSESVNLRVVTMKGYSTFLRVPEQEPHHQKQFNVIPRTSRCANDVCGIFCYQLRASLFLPPLSRRNK